MTVLIPFGVMIGFAVVLLAIAKPLDRWHESRLSAKEAAPTQRRLFEDIPSRESDNSLVPTGHK